MTGDNTEELGSSANSSLLYVLVVTFTHLVYQARQYAYYVTKIDIHLSALLEGQPHRRQES